MEIINTLLLVLLGLMPGLTWLVFYLREDVRHPEPKILLLYAFMAGALITLMVLQIQVISNRWLASHGVDSYGPTSFLILGGIEEFFKFLAVYLVIRHRKEFDEPIDAMIYMIVAALGFASVENIASVFQATNGFYPNPGPVETTMLRFVGATLLHTLASGFVGYEWGRAIVKKEKPAPYLALGVIGATLLHTFLTTL